MFRWVKTVWCKRIPKTVARNPSGVTSILSISSWRIRIPIGHSLKVSYITYKMTFTWEAKVKLWQDQDIRRGISLQNSQQLVEMYPDLWTLLIIQWRCTRAEIHRQRRIKCRLRRAQSTSIIMQVTQPVARRSLSVSICNLQSPSASRISTFWSKSMSN